MSNRGFLAVPVAIAFVLVLGTAPARGAEPQASLPDIEDEVMCTVCGTSLALVPNAPQAEQERDLIRELIADGKTKDEIKAALVAEYGPEVLAMPDDEGFDLAAWIVPLAGIAIAIGAIGVAVSRWRRAAPAPPAAVIEPGDERRLAEDMRRY